MTVTIYKDREFNFQDEFDRANIYSDIEFINCSFVSCMFSPVDIANLDDLDLVGVRSTARNLCFINCEVRGCSIDAGIVEDVIVDGLKVHGHLQSAGTVFKHVVFKGRIDKLMITPYVDFFGHFPAVQTAFDEANRKYYEKIDLRQRSKTCSAVVSEKIFS